MQQVYDISTFDRLETLEGHDNPVCTLAVANSLLFSGSLKVIKIWDVNTFELLGEFIGALFAMLARALLHLQ